MGEDVTIDQVDAVKKTLKNSFTEGLSIQIKALKRRQRLSVWYRNDDSEIIVHNPYTYTQIDMTGDRSAVDIGRTE